VAQSHARLISLLFSLSDDDMDVIEKIILFLKSLGPPMSAVSPQESLGLDEFKPG